MTILSFVAIFAGVGIVNTEGDYASALMLVSGVFIGSSLWWMLLSSGASFFQKKVDVQGLAWINKISGAIIVGFGLAGCRRELLYCLKQGRIAQKSYWIS